MNITKKIEWLKDHMPKNTDLHEEENGSWNLLVGGLGYPVYATRGDIGVAPLTTLMKQDLGAGFGVTRHITGWQIRTARLNGEGWIVSCDWYDTEFDAVFYLYRAAKGK